MFMLGFIALIFGGKVVLDQISYEQWYLALLAFVITVAFLVLGFINIQLSLFNLGLSSIILLIIYLIGMRLVYVSKSFDTEDDDLSTDLNVGKYKAWIMFGMISIGVIISGYFLAFSVDKIAEISGIASSTLGIILVSIVTTMPEASAYFASVKMKAADLGVAGLFGSCVFNITIIFYADIFYKNNLLVNQFEKAHYLAGFVASLLILLALFIVLFNKKFNHILNKSLLASLLIIYLFGIFIITS